MQKGEIVTNNAENAMKFHYYKLDTRVNIARSTHCL